MVNNVQIVRIVNRAIVGLGLGSREADTLRAWARRWNTAWTTEAEYTLRAVETMTLNAGRAVRAGELQ